MTVAVPPDACRHAPPAAGKGWQRARIRHMPAAPTGGTTGVPSVRGSTSPPWIPRVSGLLP